MKYIYRIAPTLNSAYSYCCWKCQKYEKDEIDTDGRFYRETSSGGIYCYTCIEILEKTDPDFAIGMEANYDGF